MNPLVLFLLWPILEIAGFILVGDWIGLWPTLGLIILAVVLGVSLLRWQGLTALRKAQEASTRGEVPVGAMLNSACVVIASILLIVPGFLTDILAILLLIAPLRRLIGGVFIARASRNGSFSFKTSGNGAHTMNAGFNYESHGRSAGRSGVIDGDFRDVTSQDSVAGDAAATSDTRDKDDPMPKIEDSRWAQPGRPDGTTRD